MRVKGEIKALNDHGCFYTFFPFEKGLIRGAFAFLLASPIFWANP